MFKLARTHRFWRTVTVIIPDPEKVDAVVEHKFQVEFEAIPGNEAIERLRQIQEEKPGLTEHEYVALALAERVHDWREVVDGNGEPVPFSREVFEDALRHGWTRNAVWEAYTTALSGRTAQQGN